MSSRVLAVSLIFWVPCAVATPVPPPRLVTAEAVLKPVRNGPRDLAALLTSWPVLNAALRSRATALGCLRHERDPHAWLKSRLKVAVDSDRGTVTLRLADCPRQDAVTLLSAVVEAYKVEVLGRGPNSAKAREREVLVRLLIANQMNAQVAVNGAVQQLVLTNGVSNAGPTKAEVDSCVLQAPRVVQPGLPGRECR